MPLLDYRNRDPRALVGPKRTIQITHNGKMFEMDWDKPTPPTQADVLAWAYEKINSPSPASKIDTSVPEMKTLRVTNPLEILGATGSATGRGIGSLMDKPGNLKDALFEGAKGARDAVTGQGTTTPIEELDKRTGVQTPGAARFLIDAALDIGNVADPMTAFSHGAPLMVGMAARTGDDAIKALARKGLKSLEKTATRKAAETEIKDLARQGLESLDRTAARKAEEEAASKVGPKSVGGRGPSGPKGGGGSGRPPTPNPNVGPTVGPPNPNLGPNVGPPTPPTPPPTPPHPNPTPNPTPNPNPTPGNRLRTAFDAANQLRIASLLSGWALPKSLLGNIGAPVVAAAENLTAGKGLGSFAPIREAFNIPENIRQFGAGWRQGANPTYAGASGIGKYNPITRTMNAADYATTEGLKRAGLTEEEAQRLLLRDQRWGPSGPSNPISDYLVPFKKTPFNTLFGGAETMMKHPGLALGAGAAGASVGSETGDPRALGLSAALLGPYALPYLVGASIPVGGRALGGLSPIPDWSLERSIGDPFRPFTAPAFTTMFDSPNDSGGRGGLTRYSPSSSRRLTR